MDTIRLRIRTVDPSTIATARRTGRDGDGNPLEHVVAGGGEPLRCCLAHAAVGEDLVLLGYRPQLPACSPYTESGAIFVHATLCGGPASTSQYPPAWMNRPQVIRAYDQRGWIHPATTLHDGTDSLATLTAVLQAKGVVEAHSRNIAYGCFMFSARLTP